MPRLRNLTKQKMQKQTEHITRLCIDGGNSNFELLPISRNLNRFYNIFLCGEKLCEGCKAVFFYADDLENPFYEQTFSEVIHTMHDDWILSISRWHLRRETFKGEFQILIRIYAVDGSSEIAEILIPVRGKRGVKRKGA